MTNQEQFQSGHYYHVFNRGNNYENIFREIQNYDYFLLLMLKHLLPICEIFAYCFMPNHFHLLIQIKSIDNLPEDYKSGKKKLHQPFSNFFNAYTKAVNKKYHRRGSLFQEHLKRNRIESDTYFKNLILYIHLNPDHHRFKESYNNYPFSSYAEYISMKDSFIEKGYVLELFGDLENFVYCHEQKKRDITIFNELEVWDT
jgi:REP element-mobilizing transposase RayT